MKTKRTSYRCRVKPQDKLTLEVVGGRIFVTVQYGDRPQDIQIKPKHARAVAKWLEQAALEAEQAE